MPRISLLSFLAGLGAAGTLFAQPFNTASKPLVWKQLPTLPDREGFASSFAGVSDGALLVAGGANFPDKRPWDGGTKIWYDQVFAMVTPAGGWIEAGRLNRPIAYGVSISAPEGVICAGGGDATAHFRDVFLLQWQANKLQQRALPPLPRTCAFAAGALVGRTFYLAGGIEKPESTGALATLWALDVAQGGAAWRELPHCPGKPRMLAVAGALADTFYYFGGVALSEGPDGKAVRTPLLDAYSYSPANGWRKLAGLPRAVTAAPSPAPVGATGKLLVISGDDGLRAHLNGPNHPGFPTDVLAYDPITNRWESAGEAPFSRATAPTAFWQGHWIVASGERKPGYRSPEVWLLDVEPAPSP